MKLQPDYSVEYHTTAVVNYNKPNFNIKPIEQAIQYISQFLKIIHFTIIDFFFLLGILIASSYAQILALFPVMCLNLI